MEKKHDAAAIDKMQAQINRGNMAQIALRNGIQEYVNRRRVEKLAVLEAYFKEGKPEREISSVIAQLAALTELETDFRNQVVQGNRAFEKLREMENEDTIQKYREY